MNIIKDKELREITESEIQNISYNSKLRLIAVNAPDIPITFFQYPSLKINKRITHRERIITESEEKAQELLEIHKDSQYSEINNYYLDEDKKTIKGPIINASQIAFSNKGDFLVLGYENGDLSIFDCLSWKKLADLKFDEYISSIQFVQNDAMLFIMTSNWKLILIETTSWTLTQQIQLERFNKGFAIISQDLSKIFTITDKKRVHMIDFKSQEEIQEYKGHKSGINMMVLSPDEKILATCGNDHKICLFNTESGQLLHYLLGHEDEVHSIAFSSDGKYLFSSSEDTTLRVWSVENYKPVRTISYVPNALDMKVSQNYLFMGNIEGGLKIFKML
jgi:WD40 repeat protein